MRRGIILLLVLSLTTGVVACGLISTAPTSQATETTSEATTEPTSATETTTATAEDERYVDGVLIKGDVQDIEVVLAPDRADGFSYTIDRIEFFGVANVVSIHITLDAPVDRTATYHARFERKGGGGSSSSAYFALTASDSQELSFRLTEGTDWYVFRLEKKFLNHLDEFETMQADTRVEYRLPNYDTSHRVEDVKFKFDDETPDSTSIIEMTSKTFTLSFLDPERIVTSVTIAFYEKDIWQYWTELTVPVPSARDADGRATLSNIVATGLVPGIHFTAVAYASGNNGVRDYADAPIGQKNFDTYPYFTMFNASLAMHAYIPRHSLTEEGWLIDVHTYNDRTLLHPVTRQPYSLVLRLVNKAEEVVWEMPLEDAADATALIPNELLSFGAWVLIVDVTGTVVLFSAMVPIRIPSFVFHMGFVDGVRTLMITFSPNDCVAVDGFIEFYVQDVLYDTFAFDQWSSGEQVVIRLPGVPTNTDALQAVVHLTYSGFDDNDEDFLEKAYHPS